MAQNKQRKKPKATRSVSWGDDDLVLPGITYKTPPELPMDVQAEARAAPAAAEIAFRQATAAAQQQQRNARTRAATHETSSEQHTGAKSQAAAEAARRLAQVLQKDRLQAEVQANEAAAARQKAEAQAKAVATAAARQEQARLRAAAQQVETNKRQAAAAAAAAARQEKARLQAERQEKALAEAALRQQTAAAAAAQQEQARLQAEKAKAAAAARQEQARLEAKRQEQAAEAALRQQAAAAAARQKQARLQAEHQEEAAKAALRQQAAAAKQEKDRLQAERVEEAAKAALRQQAAAAATAAARQEQARLEAEKAKAAAAKAEAAKRQAAEAERTGRACDPDTGIDPHVIYIPPRQIASIATVDLARLYEELFDIFEWENGVVIDDNTRRKTAMFCVELFKHTKLVADSYEREELQARIKDVLPIIEESTSIAAQEILDKHFKKQSKKLKTVVQNIAHLHAKIHAHIMTYDPRVVYHENGKLGETSFDKTIHRPADGSIIKSNTKCFALFPGLLERTNPTTALSKTLVMPTVIDVLEPESSFQRLQYAPFEDQAVIESLFLFGEVKRHLLHNVTPEKAAVLSFISRVEKGDGTYDLEAVGDAVDAISVYFA